MIWCLSFPAILLMSWCPCLFLSWLIWYYPFRFVSMTHYRRWRHWGLLRSWFAFTRALGFHSFTNSVSVLGIAGALQSFLWIWAGLGVYITGIDNGFRVAMEKGCLIFIWILCMFVWRSLVGFSGYCRIEHSWAFKSILSVISDSLECLYRCRLIIVGRGA